MNRCAMRILSLVMALLPLSVAAQSNIKSAFDAIIKCKQAEITQSQYIDRNPSTGQTTGMYEIYNFELPADKMDLVKKVMDAFDRDSKQSYSMLSGAHGNKNVQLAVGDGSTSVNIADRGWNCTYATFLAPKSEDPEGIYRYAYGLGYKEEGRKIVGRLVTTYAYTLAYRQKLEEERGRARFLSDTDLFDMRQQKSWVGTMMQYLQLISTSEGAAAVSLATKAYGIVKDISKYPDVTVSDKNMVREILKAMISDKKYSDLLINKLLVECLNGIK